MKIIVACDSFKGSMTSAEAGEAAADGLRSVMPDAVVTVVPVGDGGEGTAQALAQALGASAVSCMAHDPAGRPVSTHYYIYGTTAIIETAAASGLTLLSPAERRPLEADSSGTGELIADALRRGCRKIIIGLGGSGTCDGGMGMLAALGVRFADVSGAPLRPCGKALEKIAAIDTSGIIPEARTATFCLACDVTNPLTGPEGAAAVFAPQKGADAQAVERLEAGLRNFSRAAAVSTGRDMSGHPGAGAAGGIGYALMEFFNTTSSSGIDTVLDVIDFDSIIAGADLIVTGEGRIDRQTLMGKTPSGILARGKCLGVPVVVLAGSVEDRDKLLAAGFADVRRITPAGMSLAEAMRPDVAAANLSRAAASLIFDRKT